MTTPDSASPPFVRYENWSDSERFWLSHFRDRVLHPVSLLTIGFDGTPVETHHLTGDWPYAPDQIVVFPGGESILGSAVEPEGAHVWTNAE